MNSDHDMKGEPGENFSNDAIAELTAKQKQSEKDNSQEDVSDAYQNDIKEKNLISLLDFLKQFHAETNSEKKIHLGLEFMRQILAQENTARFKEFWEVRKLCLSLFKEDIPASTRADLWNVYTELALEAKQLKEILDQQSAFAVEQIELAIEALEKDIANIDVLRAQIADVQLPEECFSLQKNRELYGFIQNELQLLNTLAMKINSLRKELLKTQMRIRIKNKLLIRISACGNQVFPKRKELIKQISEQFGQDIEFFIQAHRFQEGETKLIPSYALREEIKHLQKIAKILTLNTHIFTETRLKLSSFWDEIKNYEKERKKITQEKKLLFKQNFDLISEKIQLFAKACNEEISLQECDQQMTEILNFMRTVQLGREEVQVLKEQLYNVKKPILEKAREIQKIHIEKLQEKEKEKKDRLDNLVNDLKSLIQRASELSLEQLTSQNKALEKIFDQVHWKQTEKHMLDRLFKQIKDLIHDNKEKTLMLLSKDDQKALEELHVVLSEKKSRRKELKEQLEQYRKLLGGSGLDFEKTMMYRELMEADKKVLEKMNISIVDIKKKIKKIAEMEI